MIEQLQLGMGQPVASEQSSERKAAERRRGRCGRPLRHPVFHASRQVGERSWLRTTPPHSVVALLAAVPPAAQRLRRIGRRRRDDVYLLRIEPGMSQACLDGLCREANFELAPAEALFVHGEAQPAFLEERSARIVSVPDAEYIHGVGGMSRSTLSPISRSARTSRPRSTTACAGPSGTTSSWPSTR